MAASGGERRAALVAALLALQTAGCTLPYLADTAAHHLALLARRRPLAEVIADPATPAPVRDRLREVDAIRRFAAGLGLAVDDHYAAYVAVKGRYVTYNLSACPPDRLAPYLWHFPFVGAVPYKGYFRKGWAERERRRLERQGYETYLRGVTAYSTLGRLPDPLLSTMVGGDLYDLADTLFHELTHATLFIRGQVAFDETLATFFAEHATLAFAAAREGADSPAVARLRAGYAEAHRFDALVHQVVEELEALYCRHPEDWRRQRQRIWERFRRRLHDPATGLTAPWHRTFADAPLNNARLLAYHRYHQGGDLLASLLAAEGGDLRRFLERLVAHREELREAPLERIRGWLG